MNRTTHHLIQGSAEWAAFRATHYGASDAPAMMGASKYRSRGDLVRQAATGITEDVTPDKQALFNRGHAAEAESRPKIEAIIGEELYPVTMSADIDGLPLSASLDGLNLGGDTIFEHKLWSESLAEQVRTENLEPHYFLQLEQQLLVSGAERVIFATGEGDKLETMWYYPVAGRAEALIAGWKQFQADVADYVPANASTPVTAAPVEGFGALSLRVEGRVLASNLEAFRAGADAFLARLPKASELETDQDFADAEAAVKACTEAEARIKAAKDMALAQMADVDAVLRAADTVAETIRAARLALDKVVKAEKENRRAMTIAHYVKLVGEHIAAINKTLGEFAISAPPGLSHDIASAAKGKRTIMRTVDACDQAAAAAKIAASQKAETIRQNVAVLAENDEHSHLLPDRVALAHSLTPDVLRSVIRDRLDDAWAKEAARIDAERIRAEEQAQAEAFDKLNSTEERMKHSDPILSAVPAGSFPSKQEAPRSTVKLGQINESIAPLTITAAGLAQLGFAPVGKERAAVLYDAADVDRILSAMIDRIESARTTTESKK